jgi:hypothetical protein
MAVCKVCKQDMSVVKRCLDIKIRFQRRSGQGLVEELDKIRMGAETRFGVSEPDPTRLCHDCGVEMGACHHSGCDWESCPRCQRQAISCDCNDTHIVSDLVPEAP